MQVFNLAAGQLVNESTIHFYARFIEIIGHLKNGASTEYARIECTRERRIKGSGFRVQLHSYPIAMKDIDISAVPSLRIHLKSEKQFKVPRVA
ncbi:hypothetical protein C7K08_14340 [Synechococcus lacustris str. Tous]|uniref:Uncharacterized protein n=2 Tax=Synechococcus TaxID=1129 RepID=A0A2P7EAH0_9SYNE|nr:hypothetical protein C7K08_14340 [Synechococcus lacustris str. Tous]